MSYMGYCYEALLVNEVDGQVYQISAPTASGATDDALSWSGTGEAVLTKLGLSNGCKNLATNAMVELCESMGGKRNFNMSFVLPLILCFWLLLTYVVLKRQKEQR